MTKYNKRNIGLNQRSLTQPHAKCTVALVRIVHSTLAEEG